MELYYAITLARLGMALTITGGIFCIIFIIGAIIFEMAGNQPNDCYCYINTEDRVRHLRHSKKCLKLAIIFAIIFCIGLSMPNIDNISTIYKIEDGSYR